MNLYAILGLSFVPAVTFFILALILNKELKIKYCLWSCLLAMVTIVPATFIQYYVLNLPIFTADTFAAVMITSILFNGLIEESMKMLFICFIPQKKQILSTFFSCVILYGLTVGGFESVIYIIKKFQEITVNGGREIIVELLLKRIFSAQAIHVFCAGLSGLFIWNFRHGKKYVMPFIYAVLLHGIYNFFTGFNSIYHYLSVVAILFAAVECRIFYQASENSQS